MLWVLLAVLFLPAAPSWAADGDIDTAFGTGGRATTDFGTGYEGADAKAVAIQTDGKIVAAGYKGSSYDPVAGVDFALARYNTDGTLDATFGTGGKVTTYTTVGTGAGGTVTRYFYIGSAKAVAIQSDGKIVVAGYIYNSPQHVNSNQHDFALARFNTDGTLDATFGSGGIVVTALRPGNDNNDMDYAYAVAIQADGKIVAAGSTGPHPNGSYDPNAVTTENFALVRYNMNGTPDTSFGASGIVTADIGTSNDKAYAVAIQSDGKIVAAGYSYSSVSNANFALARFNTNGTLDANFGTAGKVTTDIGTGEDYAYGIAIQSDGKIVAAGVKDGYYFALVRYNTNVILDTTFGTGGMVTTTNYDKAYAVAIQSDGKIVAAGYCSISTGVWTSADSGFLVVRYLTGAATPTPTPQPSPTPLTTPSPTQIPTLPPPQGGAGVIFGFINDADDNALQGVTVTLDGADSSESVTTDEEGYFEFGNLSAGDYTLTCEKEGYETFSQDISLGDDEIQEIGTIVLEEVVKAKISGYVVDIKGDPIENVRIKAKGVKTGYKNTATSDADGFFEFPDLEADTYVLVARKKGYKRKNTTVKLGEGESEEVEITLKKTSKRIIKASAL